VFSNTDQDSVIPAKDEKALERNSPRLRSVVVNNRKFGELKYSEREICSIAESFRNKGLPAMSYLHKNASENNFKMNADKYSYIHIATHGCINEEHPELSTLIFSQLSEAKGSEDGILFAGETYDLTLKADLIILSCCESGIGKYVKGEGMMAMTRGFFYSGARNIIFSLWKVYDRHTDDLMLDFYRRVLEGRTYSSALRTAKLRMIDNRATAFPLMWGGFVLVGK
jgi:CHAT domain-containing protein